CMPDLRTLRDRLVLGAVAVGLCGADCREPGTEGDSGEYSFYYTDATSITEFPLIPFAPDGTHATLVAVEQGSGCGGSPSFSQVRSTDPEIAMVSLNPDDTIALVTGSPGTAR